MTKQFEHTEDNARIIRSYDDMAITWNDLVSGVYDGETIYVDGRGEVNDDGS